jgi:hypothetical protein
MLSLPIDVMRIIARKCVAAYTHRQLALVCQFAARAVMLERKRAASMLATKCDDMARLIQLQPCQIDLPALLQQAAQYGSLRVWMYLAPLTDARVDAAIMLLTESSRQNRPDALRIMYERCNDSKAAGLHLNNRIPELRDWVFELAAEFEIPIKLTARTIRACWPYVVKGNCDRDKVWEMIGSTYMITDDEMAEFVTERKYVPSRAHGPHQLAWMFANGYMPDLMAAHPARFNIYEWIVHNGHMLSSKSHQKWLIDTIKQLMLQDESNTVVRYRGREYNPPRNSKIRPLLHAIITMPSDLRTELRDIEHVQEVPRLWLMTNDELNEDRERIDEAVIDLVYAHAGNFFIEEHGAVDEQDAVVCLCRLFHRRLDAKIAEYYKIIAQLSTNKTTFARFVVNREHMIVDKTVKEIGSDIATWVVRQTHQNI